MLSYSVSFYYESYISTIQMRYFQSNYSYRSKARFVRLSVSLHVYDRQAPNVHPNISETALQIKAKLHVEKLFSDFTRGTKLFIISSHMPWPSISHLTAVAGVGSSPALATCETSQLLLAGVPGGFSRGSLVFAHLLIYELKLR